LNNHHLQIIDEIFVTVFYIGKIKFAPGTFGSMFALLVLFFPDNTLWILSFSTAILLSLLSHKSISRYEKLTGDDNSSIVIDEVIGMLIVFSNPYMIINPFWVIIAFFLFRFFDILKPYPISLINNKKGAIYVVADDVVAGLFSLVILYVFQIGYRILPFFLSYFNIF
jgi:phosphatidylglycerophosphatase A